MNDFFKIVSIDVENDTIRCKVQLNSEHEIYRVHFPGNPVTPGVCLVQMAEEILVATRECATREGQAPCASQASHTGDSPCVSGDSPCVSLSLRNVPNIKFKRLVSPQEEPTFVFTKIHIEDGQLSTSVSVEDDGVQFVKMSLKYKIVD